MTRNPLPAFAVAFATLLAAAAPAHAASGYDACTGFIDSLPAVISTQGVWCLNKDLATSLTSGFAIAIANNNVTIDCNGFKLGGLAAGVGTETTGIQATGFQNATVRDCNIRGFNVGVWLGNQFSSGHRVEGNRFEANTAVGVIVQGTGGLVRDNVVVDTGGTTANAAYAVGIIAVYGVDVIDNQIAGVDGAGTDMQRGIGLLMGEPDGVVVDGNRFSGITYPEGGDAVGVLVDGTGTADIRNNSFVNLQPGYSVLCNGTQHLYANALMMGSPGITCLDGGGNYGVPVVL